MVPEGKTVNAQVDQSKEAKNDDLPTSLADSSRLGISPWPELLPSDEKPLDSFKDQGVLKEKSRLSAQTQSEIQQCKKALARALELLQMAKELSIQEYFAVYLQKWRGRPEVLRELAGELSDSEVTELLKLILAKPTLATSQTQSQRPSPRPRLIGGWMAK